MRNFTGNTVNDINMIAQNGDEFSNDDIIHVLKNSNDGFSFDDFHNRFKRYCTAIDNDDIDNIKEIIIECERIGVPDLENVLTNGEDYLSLIATAIEDFDGVILNEPFHKYYAKYGDYLCQNEQFEDAKYYLLMAFSLNPYDFDCAYSLSNYYFQIDLYDEAIDVVSQAICYEIDFDNLGAYYMLLAGAFSLQEEDDLANACYTMAVEHCPELEEPDDDFEKIDFGEAIDILDENEIFTDYDENVINLMYEVGMNYYNEDNFDYAKYYLSIYYWMSFDEEIQKILEEISGK